ncbi:MAG TPA: hypothetical protein VLR92_00220 [Blastocatellia bacterium]|nr:hypothetical protein [Blastocatellia bacterium]
MKTDQPLFLNEEQVREHLQMTELIPAMEKALIDFSAGRVTQPVRSIISIDPPGGFLGLMPALTPDGLGLKAVTFYSSNAERGIPTHMATIFLVDPQNGNATRDNGRAVNHRDENRRCICRGDETARIA